MATSSVTSLVSQTLTASTASPSSTFRATPQAGILEGSNPSHYDPKNPIIIFIIQAAIIVIFCRLLHYPLSLMRQPRVIAEVIGGILLGPSVMGRIPGFSDAIFPASSIPNLNLVANLGLVLFLFLVGLEVDLRLFVSNWKVALSVGTAGMALPFGLGCAIAWGLYHEFRNEPDTVYIPFGTYMLFIGVAMAITAFPVLCRILTELKLLSTPVGLIVLSAGVGNDVLGWILLALCVALVNAGSGLTALWVLLVCVGYALFLYFAVRPAFLWYLKRTSALQDGPSQGVVTLTLMIVLASSFLTGVIGVHPIFGAFMAGLICPHDGGFAIKLTEKVEDLIGALFLPLYFALSGLSTNLGLLNSGIAWAYVVGVIATAFFAKFAGGTLAARLNGLVWRESATIGVLMSCKGLVELIVLNIGLQAKILSTRTFTIFVVMALVTTFATTPLTMWLYPPWYQRKLEAWKRGEIDWETGTPSPDAATEEDDITFQKVQSPAAKNLLVYLRLDTLPTILDFVSLLSGRSTSTPTDSSHNETAPKRTPTKVHGVRLIQLTDRDSSVMKVSEVNEYTYFDPVINTFRMLGQLYDLVVSGEVAVVPESSYAETLVSKSMDETPDLLLLPWSETGGMSEVQAVTRENVRRKLGEGNYASFVQRTLTKATCNVALLISEGLNGATSLPKPPTLERTVSALSGRSHREWSSNNVRNHHVFLPFLGGADGRLALRLALQVVKDSDVTASIVHFQTAGSEGSQVVANIPEFHGPSEGKAGVRTGSVSMMDDLAFFATLRDSLPREAQSKVTFTSVSTVSPVEDILVRAREEVVAQEKKSKMIVVLGRDAAKESSESCFGAVASKILDEGVRTSLLVVQARRD